MYMAVSRHQNAEKNYNLLASNNPLENVAKFKYLETTVTNQNCIHEEIKSRSNSGNACCHSVQSVFRLLSKNLHTTSYKTIILLVLYGCETWSFTLREEQSWSVSENWVLKRMFGPEREAGEHCIMRSFVTCRLHKILLG
jgi:hypothetical protein